MGKRSEAIHDTIKDALRSVYGRTFEPEDILSWEQVGGFEEGFRHYLREYNVKTGTRRPASPKTRERLRKDFYKDHKVYYARLKPLKKAIYTHFLAEEFTTKRVWSLKPAEGGSTRYPATNSHRLPIDSLSFPPIRSRSLARGRYRGEVSYRHSDAV